MQIGYALRNLTGGLTIESSFVGLNFRSAREADLMPRRVGRVNRFARFCIEKYFRWFLSAYAMSA